MSENEIQVHNMADAIREKIRNTIFDAIPDDQIDNLIKSEFERFFKDTKRTGYSSEGYDPSPFKKMVRSSIDEIMKERIKTMIQKKITDLTIEWDGNNHKLIGKLVEDMAPIAWSALQKSFTEHIVQNSLMNMKDSIHTF